MKKLVSLLLVLVMSVCVLCAPALAEDAVIPAGVLSFLNYSEEEFANASVIWNYLGISLFNNGYVQSKVMVPMDPEYALAATAADYPVRFYDSLDAMVMGLLSGEIISFDIYSCVAEYICAQNENLVNYVQYDTTSDRSAFVGEVLDRFSNGFSFMMLEENEALRDEFDVAIAAMKEDGTLQQLIDEHITKVVNGEEPQVIVPDKIDGAETITVAVTGSLPPMDYIAPDGTVAGFNTAILAEIGRRIGKNIKFEQVDSLGRAMALSSGTVDVVFWVRGISTGSKTYKMTDEEFAAYKAEMEKDFTPEEKEAIAHLDEILPRVKEYTRDMPDGTIITEPYYSDIPVGVMQRDVYDYYVAYIESMMAQAAE